jgi:hypothetical protein
LSTENQNVIEVPTTVINESDSTTSDSDDDESNKEENVFGNQSRSSQFEAFASDQPLNTLNIESIAADIVNQLDESRTSIDQQSEVTKSTGDDEEPWELEDNTDEKLNPTQKNDSSNNFFPEQRTSAPRSPPTKTEESEDDESNEGSEKKNYDDYFSKNKSTEDTEQSEAPLSKTVRFDENLENVNVLTPKDSLEQSESSSTTSDTDENEDEHMAPTFPTISDRISDHMNKKDTSDDETNDVEMRSVIPRPDSNISLTESEDLPPPLPPLPPLNKKSSNFLF